MKFYILSSYDNHGGFFYCDDDGVPTPFDTEEEAVEAAKAYAPALVLKAVTNITETRRLKVERLK